MTSRPKVALTLAGACAVVALLVLPLLSPEEGTAADLLWLVQMIVSLIGLVALVMGLVGLRRSG